MTKHHLGQVLKRPLGIVAVVLCLALGACGVRRTADEVTAPPQSRALAERAIADLQRGPAGDDDLLAFTVPPRPPQVRSGLATLRATVPAGPGSKIRLVHGRTVMSDKSGRTIRYDNLSYEVSRGDQRALVRIQIVYEGGPPTIGILNVMPITVPAYQLNPLTLGGKPFGSYFVLALLGLSSAISIAAAIFALRTPGIRMQWLWVFGCLWSFGEVMVDWTSGGIVFTPFALHLLGGAVRRQGLLDPWQVAVGLPLVALTFLILRKRLQRPAPSRPASATT